MTEYPKMVHAGSTTPLLEITNLEVVYHRAATAIQGVSLKVEEGSITALVGTNGAGKTTSLFAIAGFMRADDVQITQGDILFEGTSIKSLPNYRISDRGISLVPERNKIFTTLTVDDNLAACHPRRAGGVMTREEIYDMFPVLDQRRHSTAGYLSGGERQMLAIGVGLMARPRLLILDEPNLGLAPILKIELGKAIARIAEENVSMIVIEQDVEFLLRLVDYLYVVEHGEVTYEVAADADVDHEDIISRYFGED